MEEGTRTALMDKGAFDEEIVKRAEMAAEAVPPGKRVRAGLQAAIEVAETDPAAARSALRLLRGDPEALARVEAWLDGSNPERTTFGLGAAMQVAYAELGCDDPDLGAIAPDLLRWLEGRW